MANHLNKKPQALYAKKYCGIFAQSKNCGARETAVASKRLWNNISFYDTAQ
jgi:hypothetical protein